MELIVSMENKCARIILTGDIDENGAEKLNYQFNQLIVQNLDELILDFAKVNYIGSSGIGQLILYYKKLAVCGGIVKIVNVSKEIYDLFLELSINKVIDISKA